jgi:hypothetical protein
MALTMAIHEIRPKVHSVQEGQFNPALREAALTRTAILKSFLQRFSKSMRSDNISSSFAAAGLARFAPSRPMESPFVLNQAREIFPSHRVLGAHSMSSPHLALYENLGKLEAAQLFVFHEEKISESAHHWAILTNNYSEKAYFLAGPERFEFEKAAESAELFRTKWLVAAPVLFRSGSLLL